MNRIASFVLRLLDDLLSRSTNSPRYIVPATSEPMSRVSTRLLSRMSGTSPATMLCCHPSAMAVLPTTGLADQGRVVLRLAAQESG